MAIKRFVSILAGVITIGSLSQIASAMNANSVVGAWRCDDFRGVNHSWLSTVIVGLLPDGTYQTHMNDFMGMSYDFAGRWRVSGDRVLLNQYGASNTSVLLFTDSGLYDPNIRATCWKTASGSGGGYGGGGYGGGGYNTSPYSSPSGGSNNGVHPGWEQMRRQMQRNQSETCARNRNTKYMAEWCAANGY